MFPSFPYPPEHLVLFGLAGSVTREQARALWGPFMDLVIRIQRGEEVGQHYPGRTKATPRKRLTARKGGAR